MNEDKIHIGFDSKCDCEHVYVTSTAALLDI